MRVWHEYTNYTLSNADNSLCKRHIETGTAQPSGVLAPFNLVDIVSLIPWLGIVKMRGHLLSETDLAKAIDYSRGV